MPFVDNSAMDGNDKLQKERLLADHFLQEIKKIPMSEFIYGDKHIVPKNPHKWGYRIFVLADSTGVVFDFFL